jgi:transketolase
MHGFKKDITEKEIRTIEERARQCRGDIIKMTTIAGSGHPGGSMSSIDIYLTLYSHAHVAPDKPDDPGRDRIIVSHGHTSPGLYACLAALGFLDRQELLTGFRKLHSPFEGHIERKVPGVEWTTGNLGQGLSAGCGFALASRLNRLDYNTFVVMSDGEQAKGQVAEARRFARKFNLNTLTVIIDHNHIQISGRTEDVMLVNIKDNYLADGWQVLEIDGHSIKDIHNAVKQALADPEHPYAIIAETVIGKGVSFMEGDRAYHGRALNADEAGRAFEELNIANDLSTLERTQVQTKGPNYRLSNLSAPRLETGKPRAYEKETHPRVVFGNVLAEIAEINPNVPMAVLDCDLVESVRSDKFAKIRPDGFFEAGVSEHTTATIAGALSINGVVTVWADFGVFAIDEVYNQLRLNDINHTELKICATHLGYNVGPDGKTHHCIDYIGLLKNLFGFRLIMPGDPNQTDHIVRHVLNQKGNYVIGLGRTKMPVIKTLDGKTFFDEKYVYTYGVCDRIRQGKDCAILTLGPMLPLAVKADEILRGHGINPSIYNITTPLHIDDEIVREAAATKFIITYEDHVVQSGLGNTIAQTLARRHIRAKLIQLGIKEYGASDKPQELYREYSLDAESLARIVKENISSE